MLPDHVYFTAAAALAAAVLACLPFRRGRRALLLALPATAFFALLPVPISCAAAFFAVRWVLAHPDLVRHGHGWVVFGATVLIFVLAFFGLAYSIFPHIVIGRMTVWEAAIGTASLNIVFAGVAVTLPMIVAYTVFMYRVFWGKARALTYG